MTRSVERIITGSDIHMVGDGFRVRNYFPNGNQLGSRTSPFFLLDYNPPHYFPPSNIPPGVGVHPHRGFETVTLALSGAVAHHDSAGNSGTIYSGDVQWMTAGSGVLHKEYHEEAFSRAGGEFHMLQLWVNLPKQYKMHPPRYQGITKSSMGRTPIGKGSMLRVVAGTLMDTAGPAETFSPLAMGILDLEQGDNCFLEHPESWNTLYLVTKGKVTLNSVHDCGLGEMALLNNEPGVVRIETNSEAQMVVLSGEPINEPLVHYGPFLMNTAEEIHQAIADFQEGKFGTLD